MPIHHTQCDFVVCFDTALSWLAVEVHAHVLAVLWLPTCKVNGRNGATSAVLHTSMGLC